MEREREEEEISMEEGSEEYDRMLLLEELESLLEELDEEEGFESEESIARLRELGIGDRDALVRRISELHGEMYRAGM